MKSWIKDKWQPYRKWITYEQKFRKGIVCNHEEMPNKVRFLCGYQNKSKFLAKAELIPWDKKTLRDLFWKEPKDWRNHLETKNVTKLVITAFGWNFRKELFNDIYLKLRKFRW
ncbi:unnamed protein product, partial [marine sediment metagenome]